MRKGQGEDTTMASSNTCQWGILYNADALPMADMLRYARMAEEAGAHSVWAAEARRDAFVPLTAMASGLQRVRVGTAIAQFARPPVLTALSAWALAEYTQGRFVLGLGTAPPAWNRHWHGLEVTKPVARMREYIECLRTLWTATPTQPVSYRGEFFQVTDYVRLLPTADARIPIYLAGVNRRMIQLAGSHADGLILGGLNTPQYLTEVVYPNLQRALDRTGRRRQDMEVCAVKHCAVSTDARAARTLARHAIAYYTTIPYYDIVLEPMGFADAARVIRAAYSRHDIAGMLRAVTDEMVEALALAGTPDEVRLQLRQFDGLVDTMLLILIEAPSPAYHRGMLRVAKPVEQTRRRPQCDSTRNNTRFTAVSISTPVLCTSVSSTRPGRRWCTGTWPLPQTRCSRRSPRTASRLLWRPNVCSPGIGWRTAVRTTTFLLSSATRSL
jgi:probable F420-dependent oxidoreductase